MSGISEEKIQAIGDVLNNKSRPMKERFRALFTLKNIGGLEAMKCIERCFSDDSCLLKHELAYCLGQMQDPEAIPMLESVLRDLSQEDMVRHEAAEALGAIGKRDVIETLEEFKKDSVQSVAETCHLAIERIKWIESQGGDSAAATLSPYASIDPTPATKDINLDNLRRILLDDRADIYERYKVMFALRNMRTPQSCAILAEALKYGSALFRHEIAFVLGQLQDPETVPALIAGLEDQSQDEMVRHECAEALGAIATREALEMLQKYINDNKQVVRESCEVALDMGEYENSPEFQYADTLHKI